MEGFFSFPNYISTLEFVGIAGIRTGFTGVVFMTIVFAPFIVATVQLIG